MADFDKISSFIKRMRKGEQFSLVITLVLVYILMVIANGNKFLSFNNMYAMAYQLPIIGFLAIGMMISELSGGINLSIIANMNLNGVIIYLVLNSLTNGNMQESNIFFIFIAIICGFLTSVVIGIVNGFLITQFNIPAILVTLGGVNLVLTKGYTISGFPNELVFIGNGKIFNIPVAIILFIIVIIITHFILNRSSYGKQLYLTGANTKASKFSNINISKVIIIEYILSACFASFASLVLIGQMNSVKANYAESYLLVAVLASFLGGVDPNGGFGKLSGMVLASIILQFISTGLNLMRLDPFMITAMWGAIIIIILIVKEISNFIIVKIKSSFSNKTI